MFALPTGVIATGFANEIRKHEFIISWRLIAKVPLFNTLDASHIAEIATLLSPLVVPPRHAVVRLGEKADSMFFIISGEVEVEIPPEPKKLGPGEFFGEVGILKNSQRSADVISLSDCQLLELTADNFWRLVREHPEIGDRVKEVIGERIDGFDDLTKEFLDPDKNV